MTTGAAITRQAAISPLQFSIYRVTCAAVLGAIVWRVAQRGLGPIVAREPDRWLGLGALGVLFALFLFPWSRRRAGVVHRIAWVLLFAVFAWDFILKCRNGPFGYTAVVDLVFLGAVCFGKFRIWAWLVMLAAQMAALVVAQNPAVAVFILLLLLAFDGRWLPTRSDARKPVLLFDGECGLCQALVRMLLVEDAAGRLHYAPLQGKSAQRYLAAEDLPVRDFNSLVFASDWNSPGIRPLMRTDGACAALSEIGGISRLLAQARLLPRPLRDAAYRFVARTRHVLFGGPRDPWHDPAFASRFLD